MVSVVERGPQVVAGAAPVGARQPVVARGRVPGPVTVPGAHGGRRGGLRAGRGQPGAPLGLLARARGRVEGVVSGRKEGWRMDVVGSSLGYETVQSDIVHGDYGLLSNHFQ